MALEISLKKKYFENVRDIFENDEDYYRTIRTGGAFHGN